MILSSVRVMKPLSRVLRHFSDAFYITERAAFILMPRRNRKKAGRLLSAGLHSMTGYFRDDQPLY